VGRVDLEEDLSGLDVRSFGEQSLLDDAPHLGTHLGDEIGGGPAGQFGGHQHLLGLHRYDGDLGGTAGLTFACITALPAAGEDHETAQNPGGDRFDLLMSGHTSPRLKIISRHCIIL